MDRLLAFDDLKPMGVPFTREHVRRKIKAGTFPAPIKLGGCTLRWLESEVDRWLEQQVELRDAEIARRNAERGEANANVADQA